MAAAYSATKMALRSLAFTVAREIGNDSGVSAFSFVPGIVDTPLMREDLMPKAAAMMGLSVEQAIQMVALNPGYDGMMPVDHCATALARAIVHAPEYNGQVADPFEPLDRIGVIQMPRLDPDEAPAQLDVSGPQSSLYIKQYLGEITNQAQGARGTCRAPNARARRGSPPIRHAVAEHPPGADRRAAEARRAHDRRPLRRRDGAVRRHRRLHPDLDAADAASAPSTSSTPCSPSSTGSPEQLRAREDQDDRRLLHGRRRPAGAAGRPRRARRQRRARDAACAQPGRASGSTCRCPSGSGSHRATSSPA